MTTSRLASDFERLTQAPTINETGPTRDSVRERARADLAQIIERLIHAEHNVAQSAEVAANRIDDPDLAELVRDIGSQYTDSVDELVECARHLETEPERTSDARRIIDEARVIVASIRGDRGIAEAVRTNLEHLLDAYNEALGQPGFTDAERLVIARAHYTTRRRAHQLPHEQ